MTASDGSPAAPSEAETRASSDTAAGAPSATEARASSEIAARLRTVRDRVAVAAQRVGRDPAEVTILIATKTQTPAAVAEVVRSGYRLIGENRVQELAAKAPELAALLPGVALETHFIGRLQSNKIRQLVPLVSCVQSVETAALARRLAQSVPSGRTLEVFAQVNVSGEATKAGVPPEAALDLVEAIVAEPGLRLRGLMTIGLNSPDPEAVAAGYRMLAGLSDQVRGLPDAGGAHELSMGMSGDLEVAIEAGATMIRIGSAVFGARAK
jgi:pyridoxal phosphate enzyme (YggS family)